MISTEQLIYLSERQAVLDKYIFDYTGVTEKESFYKRRIAFLVELAEFINEQRDFKYWSKKKASSRDILLEEYIDGIHFLVSIGNSIKFDFTTFVYQSNEKMLKLSLTEIYLYVFQQFINFTYSNNTNDFKIFLNSFLLIAEKLNFTEHEIIAVYEKKNKINFLRQQEGY